MTMMRLIPKFEERWIWNQRRELIYMTCFWKYTKECFTYLWKLKNKDDDEVSFVFYN